MTSPAEPLKSKKSNVGVIIARFQVDSLHEAHRALVETVQATHERVLVFLGISALKNSPNNPIPFIHRARMIIESYPHIEVYPVHDMRSDELWSNQLDRSIMEWVPPGQTVTLYGSRDSFIKHYSGRFPVEELISNVHISGSEVRTKIITNYPSSKDFRAGMIASTGWRYPTAYQTVDVVIFNADNSQIILGRKRGEMKMRFIGGFSDPSSVSLEDDATREVLEETGVVITSPEYIGSCRINDWRYRSEKDTIKTAFFKAHYVSGTLKAADDIAEARWVSLADLTQDMIVDEHVPLFNMLQKKHLPITHFFPIHTCTKP